jgi:hypothetical protein
VFDAQAVEEGKEIFLGGWHGATGLV